MSVIYRTSQQEWADVSLAKKELMYYRKRNNSGKYDRAIKKEETIIRSFMDIDRAA